MKEETKYICPSCGWTSNLDEKESWPDHCPNCLSGIHETDEEGGECGGMLEPVGIWVRESDAWEIVERCRLCGEMTAVEMSDRTISSRSCPSRQSPCPPLPSPLRKWRS